MQSGEEDGKTAMSRPIGAAEDFWRVRVTRVDASDELDFEWHEDILWRAPRVQDPDDIEVHLVEAVSVTQPERIVRLAAFGDADEALEYADTAREDLQELTASQFEAAYFPDGAQDT